MTWQVEQAQEPPQAPVIEIYLSYVLDVYVDGGGGHIGTFHFEIVGLGYVEEVVAVAYLEGVRFAIFIYDSYIAPIPYHRQYVSLRLNPRK